jgi:hypothetical protein
MHAEGRDMRSITILALALLLAAVPAAAQAQWETESDPIAFALHGLSLHVARELPGGRERLQIGVFGADVPASWLPHQFTERSRGITMEVDYFLGNQPAGMFIGLANPSIEPSIGGLSCLLSTTPQRLCW